jgi:hypothetical protein
MKDIKTKTVCLTLTSSNTQGFNRMNGKIKIVCMILMLTLSGFVAVPKICAQEIAAKSGADTILRFMITFPYNISVLSERFANNEEVLKQLSAFIHDSKSYAGIDSIVVEAYASPEGMLSRNFRLSTERSRVVRDYIAAKFTHLDSRKIVGRSRLFDLYELDKMVRKDIKMPHREAVIQLLESKLSDTDMMKELKIIGKGEALDYITNHFAYNLRSATVIAFCRTKPSRDTIVIKERDTIYLTLPSRYDKKPLFAVKTNLLFDLASALNIEVEVPVGERFSIAGEYIFPWWLWESKQYCVEVLNANLEVRYWFGERATCPKMTGLFAGIYGGGGYYDLEWKDKGYQGEFYSAGLTGGYVHTISKTGNWRMEYSLGLGYLKTQYREYVPRTDSNGDWHLIRTQTGNRIWFGPTRAKISLVWMFNRRIIKRQKIQQLQ